MENVNSAMQSRGEQWFTLFTEFHAKGISFAKMIVRRCKEENLTAFTLKDAKEFTAAYTAHNPEKLEEKRLQKAARNALAWLRKELRTAGISVEVDARGGANNKKGANGRTATAKGSKASTRGLPKVFEAIAILKQCADDLTQESDRKMFVHYLAMIETQERAKQ